MPNIKLNRLTKWSVDRIQVFTVNIPAPGMPLQTVAQVPQDVKAFITPAVVFDTSSPLEKVPPFDASSRPCHQGQGRNLPPKHMPDNGIQVVMFTHQDAGVWADLGSILWAAGLRVTAAWNIVTETESALKAPAQPRPTRGVSAARFARTLHRPADGRRRQSSRCGSRQDPQARENAASSPRLTRLIFTRAPFGTLIRTQRR